MAAARIHVLPPDVANKIAAGEVVQRPASVVKELLENALDAGAQAVTVVVRDGGSRLIQVADDGSGMSPEDARLAFRRHATSKIATEEDLQTVRTYGFRGEALASVAAVARVKLSTRGEGEDAATVVQIDGGGPERFAHEARERGTTVTVQNLFYNLPARLKFLKAPATEFRHVYDAVQQVAVSRPDVSLLFVSDDETVLDLRPAGLRERLVDVFGERTVDALMPLEEAGGPLRLAGYIGKPAFGRRNRAHQFLFLNGRPIANRSLGHAVSTGYEHLITGGLFPFYLLFLETDPERVDVNVHPAKLEAKFEDEQLVYRFVAGAVRKALAAAGSVPALSVPSGGSGGDVSFRFTDRQHAPSAGLSRALFGDDVTTPPAAAGAAGPGEASGGSAPGSAFAHLPSSAGDQAAPVWQLHRKYILVPGEDGVMVVDQHVAHERILYERVVRRFAAEARAAQQLLFPETLELTPGDMALVEELSGDLAAIGFEFRPLGKGTLIVDAVPPDVRAGAEKGILLDVLATFREYRQQGLADARDGVAKSFACRAAIKAGDPLTPPEMRALLRDLFATTMPYACPHGRPVVLRIPLDELDRRFGRL